MGKIAKILSEEKKMSFPTLEVPRRVEVDAMKLHELIIKEEGSNSPEPKEIRKKVEILLEMILWGEVHEKLENQKMTPISLGDEIIFELNENLRASMVKKAHESLRKYASLEDYVLKQLHEHNYCFLGND